MALELNDKSRWSAQIFYRGQKKELFGDGDGELPEDEDLEGKLRDLHGIWQLPRAGKDLSAAIWRPEHGVAEVVLLKGKLFSHMGFVWGSKLFLHIEEVLYLVDRANLLLFVDLPNGSKRLLTLQEVQELMIGAGISMERWLVYCKLMRAGYIISRYPTHWILKPSDSPQRIWGHSGLPSPPSSHTKPETHATKRRRLHAPNASQQSATLSRGHWWNIPSLGWLHGNQFLADRELSDLPRCEVQVMPSSHTMYPNMQPLQQITQSDLIDVAPAPGSTLLHYTVYPANSQFSRKTPDPPKFIVSVYPGGHPPPVEMLAAADGACGGVPIRYASVEYGDIALYAMARAELPTINHMWQLHQKVANGG